jgi:hypothetical protein
MNKNITHKPSSTKTFQTFQTFHKTRPKHLLKAPRGSPRESLRLYGAGLLTQTHPHKVVLLNIPQKFPHFPLPFPTNKNTTHKPQSTFKNFHTFQTHTQNSPQTFPQSPTRGIFSKGESPCSKREQKHYPTSSLAYNETTTIPTKPPSKTFSSTKSLQNVLVRLRAN